MEQLDLQLVLLAVTLPAITILTAPLVASRVLLSPKFQTLMFKEPVKNIIKATNMSKDEFLSAISKLRQKKILTQDVSSWLKLLDQ